ncbi:hypothetical protein PRIPAC_95924 [Pristionchus pacificus]|uniref:Uncharacterized protein n=1 Tax=Pristionchus pacificus TaxID=54126 RepID=A0A2A6CH81_PRIPA|nr:hypothetical protein PRIPAC_95924 [Pristionchus pacificus]|eukprot:PDM77423.1 hypothetical protein PRIPAC_33153 [Pristionchus pacificus]
MKTIAVFALLAVAAYAQIAPSVLTEPLPGNPEPETLREKRQTEKDDDFKKEILPPVDESKPIKPIAKRQVEETTVVEPEPDVEVEKREKRSIGPDGEIKPDVEIVISDKPEERHKRQTESEPKEETKPVDGHEIVKRQSYDEEAVVEPAQPTETPEDPANDQADEDEETVQNEDDRYKREAYDEENDEEPAETTEAPAANDLDNKENDDERYKRQQPFEDADEEPAETTEEPAAEQANEYGDKAENADYKRGYDEETDVEPAETTEGPAADQPNEDEDENVQSDDEKYKREAGYDQDSEVEPVETVEPTEAPAADEDDDNVQNDDERYKRQSETEPKKETTDEEKEPEIVKRETQYGDDEQTEALDDTPVVQETKDTSKDKSDEVLIRPKRQTETEPKEETKPEEKETVIVKRDTEPAPEPELATEEKEPTEEEKRAKRQAETETNGRLEEIDTETEKSALQKPVHKRSVITTEERKKRYIDEHPYPDCSCLHKYPHLPLYTALHSHCSYPGRPHRPHPPCHSCGHSHGPKKPCHRVHHHFVPKKPHYRAPCDRHIHHDDFDHEEYKH